MIGRNPGWRNTSTEKQAQLRESYEMDIKETDLEDMQWICGLL